MCGRYVLDHPQEISERFATENDIDLKPNYNTAPGQTMPVIIQNSSTGKNSLEIMKWGLVPFWAKDTKIGYKMINARAETLTEKPSWKGLLRHKRCLIPATGFYEWQKHQTTKTPYYFHRKDNQLFAFAGLYDIWQDSYTAQMLHTYTIITTKPNKIMDDIHDRMPVILKHENEAFWIDPQIDDQNTLLSVLTPYPDNQLERYEVSNNVNSPKENTATLLNPISQK